MVELEVTSPFLTPSPFLDDDDDEEQEDKGIGFLRGPTGQNGVWKTRRCKIISAVTLLLSLVLIFAVGLLVGHFAIPYKKGGGSHGVISTQKQEICSTPPLLLISVDGFRPSYLQRNVTPMLQYLIHTGVRAEDMRSSFPSMTFPNHYSIVTGLYPESHGIVSNVFYDSELKDKFIYKMSSSSTQSKWWGGEPVWVTAAWHKMHTGIFFWPGSESAIQGVRPDIYFKYSSYTPFSVRVDTVLGWFDLPKEKRPQFMALYFNQPDHAGHSSGPDSSEVTAALAEVDLAVRLLWNGLKNRSISDCVNIMIVSDHGMAVYNSSNFVNIANLVPADVASNVSYVSRGVISNLEVSGGDEVVDRVYNSLVNGTSKGLPFRVFPKDRLPFRLHTACYNKQRYGPIYAIADVHSIMAIKEYYRPLKGNHGYDNIEKEMQAIFIAHGPAFKKNYIAESFENVQLYSLMCDVLNITAAPNNGSYGALHALLDPKLSAKLPPPVSLKGLPGTLTVCPFPQDEQVLRERSICEDCVCRSGSCNVSSHAILSSNKALFDITSAQQDSYMSYHNPWGVPIGGYGDGACIFSQLDYVSLYSNTLKIPLWSAYTLNPEILDANMELDKVVIGCWRHDPRVSISQSTNCSTYVDPEDEDDKIMAFPFLHPMDSSDDRSMSVFTNIIFLSRSFNYQIWLTTLLKIEAWFRTYHTPFHVVLGVALDANRDGIRDQDSTYPDKHMGVAIPTHFFVVLTRCVEGGDLKSCDVKHLKVMGILLQHPLEAGDYLDVERLLRSSLTPVRDIERLTGINFFPNLSARDQNTLELRLLDELWPTIA